MTSTTRESVLGHTVSRFTTEQTTKSFAATISILPRTKERKMQIRASFFQHMTRNGGYSFTPTISFHAVIPNDSRVFRLAEGDDLDGLKQMLQDGLASLTDCDMNGRSLLGVRDTILAETTMPLLTYESAVCIPEDPTWVLTRISASTLSQKGQMLTRSKPLTVTSQCMWRL